jgi:hypothetical protein
VGAVEPLDGVDHRSSVTPVDVEAMGDDSDPHAGIGESPEGLRRAVDGFEVAIDALLGFVVGAGPGVHGADPVEVDAENEGFGHATLRRP